MHSYHSIHQKGLNLLCVIKLFGEFQYHYLLDTKVLLAMKKGKTSPRFGLVKYLIFLHSLHLAHIQLGQIEKLKSAKVQLLRMGILSKYASDNTDFFLPIFTGVMGHDHY